jgi:hypothetical protein
LKLIIVDDAVEANVYGFRYNFSYGTQQYVSNDLACDNLLARNIDKCKHH